MFDTERVPTLMDLEVGDHLCWLYSTEREHRAVAVFFLLEGLGRGQKVIYIVDATDVETLLSYLREAGVAPAPYLDSGQLSILTAEKTYLRGGSFDPKGMIAFLRAEAERALAEGYSALRVTGEMSWMLRGLPGSERLIEYEAKLNGFLRAGRCLVICQYDQRRFPADLLLDVLRTHPVVVVGTETYGSPFYVPADVLLGQDSASATLRAWIRMIEQRRQAEEETERLGRFPSENPNPVLRIGGDGVLVYANESALPLLDAWGCQANRVVPDRWIDFVSHALSSGSSKRTEVECGECTFSLTFAPVPEQGYVNVYCLDITERVRAQQELADTTRLLETILDTTPVLTVYLDPQFNFLRVNRAYAEADEREPEFFPGKNHFDLYPNAENEEIFQRVVDTGEAYFAYAKPFEYAEHLEWGVSYWDWSLIPIKGGGGRVTGLVLSASDVTERKRTEEALHRAHDELETRVQQRTAELAQANEACRAEIEQRRRAEEAGLLKTQFISNVSHELRTPLSVISLASGNLDMLYEHLDDDKRRQMIRDIREHSRVLNDLIGSVLEISRIDSGRVSMQRQWVDLARLAREELEGQRPLAQKKCQSLRAMGVEHLAVWGNDHQLRRVIRNLLNNAIKYTPDGGHITCQCLALISGATTETMWPGSDGLPVGRWAALRVVDNGLGISQEHLPHIFERFYRVNSENSIPGTGLGLSIAQELVKLHEGHVAISSTPGEGSIFAVYLPLLEE